jgi:hypothetical protein
MRNKVKLLLIVICGLFLAIVPFLFVKAQNNADEIQKAEGEKAARKKARRESRERQEKEEARSEISESLVGILVLDSATSKAAGWELIRGAYSKNKGGDFIAGTELVFGQGEEKVAISITEYASDEQALSVDSERRSGGTSKKDVQFGEDGQRITGANGAFWMLTFRQGNYRVMVASPNEKNAEQFAAYAAQAVSNLSSRKQN